MELYEDLATQFNDSRNYFEPGWSKVHELSMPAKSVIWDLGCGNGRFYNFLKQENLHIDYYGVDSSSKLLKIAQKNTNLDSQHWQRLDLTQHDSIHKLDWPKPNLINLFAVMHHLPGLNNRIALLKKMVEKLETGGYLWISFWRFDHNQRLFAQKTIDKSLVGMDDYQFELGDYVLPWSRGGQAWRFCHLVDEGELAIINTELSKAGVVKITDYFSDSKTNNQNWYWIWRKN